MDDKPISLYSVYDKEFTDLHSKYQEEYIWQQKDVDSLNAVGRMSYYPVGTKVKRFPLKPTVASAAFQIFKDCFGELQFISCKIQFIYIYKEWNLSNVEGEIQELNRFIGACNRITMPNGDLTHSYFGDNGLEIEYLKLKGEYYNTNMITDGVWDEGMNSMSAMLYGKYIRYYEFLLERRQELFDKRTQNAFSMEHPLIQLDMVLDWLCTSKEAFPSADFHTIYKSLCEKYKYDCYSNILQEILVKLEIDGKIKSWEVEENTPTGQSKIDVKGTKRYFTITWEGRYFISHEIGGYQGVANKENADSDNRAIETQRNKYLFWITISIALSSASQGVFNGLETLKNYYKPVEPITSKYIIPFCFWFFLSYILNIARKEFLKYWKRKHQ